MIRRLLVMWCALSAFFSTPARAELPATDISYRIDVSIDPGSRRYSGRQVLRWKNRAGRPISAVPMHLYLNAFANRASTWMRESFLRGIEWDAFLRQYDDPWGWVEPTAVRQRTARGERALSWRPIQPDDDNALDRTLIEVRLASAVEPDAWLELVIEFAARMPVPIARTGCVPDFCLVAQWFPKIAVLETPGMRGAREARWVAHQFHGPTEFYADFADYDVTIDAPSGWLVRATGKSQPPREPAPDGVQRVRHVQRAVHDFAIVMGSDLVETVDTHRPKGGGPEVEVHYLLPSRAAATETLLPRARYAVEGTLDVLGSEVGPYPYDILTVVTPPYRGRRTAGMEYPTLITGVPGDPMWEGFPLGGTRSWESVLVHEFGHQYWYGLLATNEREEAFLDEGFNSYWDTVGMPRLFGSASGGRLLGRPIVAEEQRGQSLARARDKIFEPMRKRPSWLFHPETHGSHIYSRPAVTFRTAVGYFGEARVHRVFSDYYWRHRFGHPDTEDFLSVARESGGNDLEAFLREAFSQPRLPDYQVVELRARPASAPDGRYLREDGSPIVVTDVSRDEHRDLVLDDRARDVDGKIWLLVTDPGFVGARSQRTGTTAWVGLVPEDPGAGGGERYFESEALLRGPAWDHLPVAVLLRFSDGAVVRDLWDGRAAWRGYRTLRRAELVEVRIESIALDVVPHNDGMRLTADRPFTSDWTSWLAAAVQWLAGGVSLWL